MKNELSGTVPVFLPSHLSTYISLHLQSCTLTFYYSIGVCSMSFCKACLSYFAFYFTLYYSWTHHSSRGSCFLSREWQITPSGSHSLWSPLYVAATIIPCTTFKHIPFALQFVQPGIITTALNPLFPPIPLHPSGSVLSLAFSTPSREAFCLFIFYFLCPVCCCSGKGAKCQSLNHICPLCNPEMNFIHIKVNAAVAGFVQRTEGSMFA